MHRLTGEPGRSSSHQPSSSLSNDIPVLTSSARTAFTNTPPQVILRWVVLQRSIPIHSKATVKLIFADVDEQLFIVSLVIEFVNFCRLYVPFFQAL